MGRANRIDPTTDPKVYVEISGKYAQFLDNCNVPAKPVVRVFDPLSKRHLDALELSREVTRELIKKKEDDMTKAKVPTYLIVCCFGTKQIEIGNMAPSRIHVALVPHLLFEVCFCS